MTKGAVDGQQRVYDLEERTAAFGEAIIDIAKQVPKTHLTESLIRQIVRSGTSVGANYCEADDAQSKADFRSNINRCKKEARETKHWLRMIVRAVPEMREPAKPLWQEAKELVLIFGAIRTRTGRR